MRFPIDTKKVADIPELEGLHRFPNELAVFAMLLFERQYREDPSLVSTEKRISKIEEDSGYSIPAPPAPGEDPSHEFRMMSEALCEALLLQDSYEHKTMAVREITLDKMLAIMLSVPDGDSVKMVETYSKCDQAIDDTLTRLREQQAHVSHGDARLLRAIESGSAIRRIRVSPEGVGKR